MSTLILKKSFQRDNFILNYMENHLIIISMIIILENFNIDTIRSRDLILFSLFQLKSEKICNMLKMAFGIILQLPIHN